MGKITKEHIDIIREYFLSLDEGVRKNMRSTISATLLKYITIIESGFIKDERIYKISTEIGFADSSEDLLRIRNEYFISLAKISLQKGSNSDLETISASSNQTFQNILNEMSDNDSFEKDMSVSLKLHQREDMKKRFQQIDDDDEFELSDEEMKAAIISVERESMKKRFEEMDNAEEKSKVFKLITRYAIAAAMIGILIGGAYLRFFNNEVSNNNGLAHNDSVNTKSLVANIELPNLIESSESNKSIIIDKTSIGIASVYESLTIKTNGLSKQIDTLRAMLEKIIPDSTNIHQHSKISEQIDSLLKVFNTYTYDYKNKKVILNVSKVNIVESIISINPNNLTQLYLKIADKYYLIKNTETPVKLYPVTEKAIISELEQIEFFKPSGQ